MPGAGGGSEALGPGVDCVRGDEAGPGPGEMGGVESGCRTGDGEVGRGVGGGEDGPPGGVTGRMCEAGAGGGPGAGTCGAPRGIDALAGAGFGACTCRTGST